MASIPLTIRPFLNLDSPQSMSATDEEEHKQKDFKKKSLIKKKGKMSLIYSIQLTKAFNVGTRMQTRITKMSSIFSTKKKLDGYRFCCWRVGWWSSRSNVRISFGCQHFILKNPSRDGSGSWCQEVKFQEFYHRKGRGNTGILPKVSSDSVGKKNDIGWKCVSPLPR